MRTASAVLLFTALAGAALAQDLPDGVGVEAPSGSALTTRITQGDADDYVFAGYPGMKLTATVKPARRSGLTPVVEVLRPGGVVVASAAATKVRPTTVRHTLDVTGVWKVRVRDAFGDEGDYTVKLSTKRPPRRERIVLDAPDANSQYRFAVPAEGGATIGLDLKWAGGDPTFLSFLDPRGRMVEGFPGGTSVKTFTVPVGLPLGDYTLAFDAAATSGRAELTRAVVPPRGPRKRVTRLSAQEPAIQPGTAFPMFGVVGTEITVGADGLIDPFAATGAAGLSLGRTPLDGVTLSNTNVTLSGRVPLGLPSGVYDLVVTSTSGQPAVVVGGFELASTPTVKSVNPIEGMGLGGFQVTLTGEHFRAGRMGVLVNGIIVPALPTVLSPTTLRFTAPAHALGKVRISVRDLDSGLESDAPPPLFEYVGFATISRIDPPLVPVLHDEPITIEGFYFAPTDKVFVETTTPGVFEEVAAAGPTTSFQHVFVPPVRPAGEYRIYVEDALGLPNPRRTKTLTYFSYADATAAAGFGSSAADALDGATSTLADVDRDGDLDLVLSRRGGATASTAPETRVFRNDGHGAFTDATSAVMPGAGADDWRADKVVAVDLDADGYTDLVLTTNSLDVPPAGRSHTRLLMNEARGGTGASAAARLYRDRTNDLMAPVRTARTFVSSQTPDPQREYVSDDWRGLDLWVGDLDGDGTGPQSIVIVHDETKTDNGVQSDGIAWGVMCGSYCTQPYTQSAGLALYWTGSRAFTWDSTARGGLGRFQFEPIAFQTYIGNYAGTCALNINYVSCPGTFTPMTGRRLAVGDLNEDGRKDVAVLSDHPIDLLGQWSSSLQVMLRGTYAPGYLTFDIDLTPKLTAFGYDLSGDTLALGSVGFPDGNSSGSIAVAWAQPGSGRRLSLYQFSTSLGETSVEDVTLTALANPDGVDAFHASRMEFRDVNADGRQDLVLLAPAAPGGTRNAVRVLRNQTVLGKQGSFRRAFDVPLAEAVTSGEHFEGDALAIGDVTGDGLLDFVVSRGSPSGGRPDTRILSTVK